MANLPLRFFSQRSSWSYIFLFITESSLVFTLIYTKSRHRFVFLLKIPIICKVRVGLPLCLRHNDARTDGGARYPAVIRFLEAEWTVGAAGREFHGVAAMAGRHGAVTRL